MTKSLPPGSSLPPATERSRWQRVASIRFGTTELNHTVLAAIGGRLWQFISGPLTVYLIARQFTEIEQGFFYAFGGYLGMQAFFELGLSGVLVSIAGHEQAAIESHDPEIARQGAAKLADLTTKSLRVYAICSLLFFLITAISGYYFFARQPSQLSWTAPWIALIAVAAFNLLLTPLLAILEGTGHARMVYRGRFLQAVMGSLAVWIALLANVSLWVAVISAVAQCAVQCFLIFGPAKSTLRRIRTSADSSISINWRHTVLPMQWRIAIQGIALYLATQALTLVLMETQSITVAGRWGMTWSILLALQSMAIAWVTAAFPQATRFSANQQDQKLASYWTRVSWASALLLVTGLVCFAAAIGLLKWVYPSLADRFIDPYSVLIFGIGMTAYHLAACLGYLVRAQKRESLYWAATLGQLGVAVACWSTCYFGGVNLLCIAYAATNALFLLPLHLLAYRIDHLKNPRNS